MPVHADKTPTSAVEGQPALPAGPTATCAVVHVLLYEGASYRDGFSFVEVVLRTGDSLFGGLLLVELHEDRSCMSCHVMSRHAGSQVQERATKQRVQVTLNRVQVTLNRVQVTLTGYNLSHKKGTRHRNRVQFAQKKGTSHATQREQPTQELHNVLNKNNSKHCRETRDPILAPAWYLPEVSLAFGLGRP